MNSKLFSIILIVAFNHMLALFENVVVLVKILSSTSWPRAAARQLREIEVMHRTDRVAYLIDTLAGCI